MFLTDLRLIFRNLLKNKITSSVNILVFAFSLAVCFTIVLYLINEFSYDSETASRAFGWGSDWSDKYFQRADNNPVECLKDE